jgi:hypothetical protein
MEADWIEAEPNYILLQFKQHKLPAGIRKYSKVLSFGIRKIFFYAVKTIPYQNSDLFVGVIFQIGAVAHSILQWEALGFSDEEYEKLGVERRQVYELKRSFAAGATVEQAASLINQEMVRAYYQEGSLC